MKKQNSLNEKVSCSMNLPRPIWRAAKIQALDEGRDFQSLVAAALEQYLAQRGKERRL